MTTTLPVLDCLWLEKIKKKRMLKTLTSLLGLATLQKAEKHPVPRQLEAPLQIFPTEFVAEILSSRYCTTVRCKRWSWLAVSCTMITPPFSEILSETRFGRTFLSRGLGTSTVRCCTRSCASILSALRCCTRSRGAPTTATVSTGAGAVKVPASATYSITGAGVAAATAGEGGTYPTTGARVA